MTDTTADRLARLRADRQRYFEERHEAARDEEREQAGHKEGIRWAEEYARYDDLLATVAAGARWRTIDSIDDSPFYVNEHGRDVTRLDSSNSFDLGFVLGASEVFRRLES
jgi:hypothetical protein